MAAIKNCPRCGTALKIAGEKVVCPSCRVSLVRKTKGEPTPAEASARTPEPPRATVAPVASLDFTPQAAAPRRSSSAGMGRGVVLGGAALFLLLGTALTGYAFAMTFSTPPEAPPAAIVQQPATPQPMPPELPTEDWRITLKDLRRLVVTPPTTLTQAPTPTKPVGPPPRVNKVIDKGVEYLKSAVSGRSGASNYGSPGGFALAGLTLLECGVPADDASIKNVVRTVRSNVPRMVQTYEIATCIWFLDRLNEAEDKPLIRSLALRLIANQGPMAGWGYSSQVISERDETQLMALLAEKPLSANWRKEMNASLVPDTGKAVPRTPIVRNPVPPGQLNNLPLFQWDPGKKYEWRAAGHEDNSLTQFAVLALWSARKQGIPVERSLAFVEARFRTYQNADGSWGYTVNQTYRRDSMTCAGLLGLAVGRGLGKQSDEPKGDVKDEAIDKALVYLGQIVTSGSAPAVSAQERATKQAEYQALLLKLRQSKTKDERVKIQQEMLKMPAYVRTRGPAGKLVGAEAWGDLYFLWSMERMAVVYDLKTIAGKDWYGWGSEILMNAQSPNGSWNEAFAGIPDTCFALLFMKRVNIVQDLTEHLRLLGKVKDPGNVAPAITLPGEVGKPDER